MNVSLTRELEELVNQRVATGKYQSASEVVREALRLLEQRDAIRQARLERLRGELRRGQQQVEAGGVLPFSAREVKAAARRRKARRG